MPRSSGVVSGVSVSCANMFGEFAQSVLSLSAFGDESGPTNSLNMFLQCSGVCDRFCIVALIMCSLWLSNDD